MEQRLTDELLHARRSFRKIAAQLLVVINKTSAPRASDRAEIKRQFPEVYRECHAIADLADQWLRSGQNSHRGRMGAGLTADAYSCQPISWSGAMC